MELVGKIGDVCIFLRMSDGPRRHSASHRGVFKSSSATAWQDSTLRRHSDWRFISSLRCARTPSSNRVPAAWSLAVVGSFASTRADPDQSFLFGRTFIFVARRDWQHGSTGLFLRRADHRFSPLSTPVGTTGFPHRTTLTLHSLCFLMSCVVAIDAALVLARSLHDEIQDVDIGDPDDTASFIEPDRLRQICRSLARLASRTTDRTEALTFSTDSGREDFWFLVSDINRGGGS